MATLTVKRGRFYLRDLPEDTEIHIKHQLTFVNPRTYTDRSDYEHKPIKFFVELKDGLSFRIGLLDRVCKIARGDGIKLDPPSFESGIPVNYRLDGQLDPLQLEAVTALVPLKLGAVELSVGSGKTITMAALADCYLNHYADSDKKVLLIVPKKQLMYQVASELAKFLPHREIGMLGDGKRVEGQILVAISNTVTAGSDDVRRILEGVGCLLVDEAHHATAPTYKEIVEEYSGDVFWALSGKLSFSDRMETIRHEAVFGAPVMGGRNETRLCDVEVVVYDKVSKDWTKNDCPGMKFDGMAAWLIPKGKASWERATYYENDRKRGAYYNGKKVTAADGHLVYDNAEDRAGVLHSERNRWIVETAESLSRRGTVVIAVRRGLHATILRHQFRKLFKLDVPVVDGKVKGVRQQELFSQLNSGEIRILIAQQNCLREGTNVPSLTDLIMASTTRSHQSLEQLKGRIERANPGKSAGRVHIPGDFHNKHLRAIVRAMMAYYRGKKRLTLKVV